MTSIFQRALGADFDRLHPQLRRRFGFSSGHACVGTGVMDEVWRGKAFTRPFLALGARRHILVPKIGADVPFVIENYAYRDSYGRETVTFVRTFDFDRPHRWDATMVYSEERGTVVDYLGTHQHLAVDLAMSVDDGDLVIRTGAQRWTEGPVTFGVPLLVSGVATVRESYDDALGKFRISVRVDNHRFGPLFGYHGAFVASYAERAAPARIRPRRETLRV
ncbi:DUF4166 domain-containing protein [Fodinicola acaciae]|uniref:DUF4166 domain-containing protein n=1 Tax=Fodinicola acaciae TaxID=2681555 RepID=UPI0013D7CC2B|nr:DUF4166 domain-containing protein [Fodinicola acaciae]